MHILSDNVSPTLLAKPGWLKSQPGVLPGPGADSGHCCERDAQGASVAGW